ncbi:VanZ family protein [Paenibacillus lycopersici]|uniref:VanZ family protein n=1 Tax=Paenibacillus lycopersici TaxID=2704462 RepID=A0A6C0FZU5_9BACL|nr:VanZ family protein [Paenibacillus lycopersici]QHT59750.1 VanZ family protein [Paenibacillus lycopersici]
MCRTRPFTRFTIGILLVLYIAATIEIIVFKFGRIDAAYLIHQLKYALQHAGYVNERIHAGNQEPFREIKRSLRGRTLYDLLCLFGNMAIFMPLGSFAGLLSGSGGRPMLRALTVSFGFSLMLETSQAVLNVGVFDVDDLLLNTAGGLLGCFVFRLYAAYWDARRDAQAKPGKTAIQADRANTAILGGKG